MAFRTVRSAYFDRQVSALPRAEQARIESIERQLQQSPVGKPLGNPFFREKRLNEKRLLFLVYQKEMIVLLVMITDKTRQQKDIDSIKERFAEFYAFIRQRL